MKSLFSILFASLILLSGMHLTVASHICCGELAAVKWSVTGEKATCGMEDNTSPSPVNGTIETDCCKNRVASCVADSNYFPSTQDVKEVTFVTAPSFAVVPAVILAVIQYSKTYHSMVGPPVFNPNNSVEQSIICVFII